MKPDNHEDLFEPIAFRQFLHRINQLRHDSKPHWGKMSPAQMFSHMTANFLVAMGLQPRHFSFGGFFYGWMVSHLLVSSKPYPKNLITDPAFLRTQPLDFRIQKEELVMAMNQFHQKQFIEGESYIFLFHREMDANDWSRALAKHLDHHLRQFGV